MDTHRSKSSEKSNQLLSCVMYCIKQLKKLIHYENQISWEMLKFWSALSMNIKHLSGSLQS